MKKILAVLLILVLNISFALAKEKDYSLNFDGKRFDLLYSVKDKEFGGYLNEYYKHGETYNIWSEMIAIHHFPNAYSPIDRIRDFKDYLSGMKVPSSLTFDDKHNTALIDFILITNNKMPIVLEFNIFKYEKSKKCGSIAVQYAKRYSATTTMQIEDIKKDFEKNRKKLIKKVEKFTIPTLITKDIDKCISALDVKGTAENNKSAEENVVQTTNADTNIKETSAETETNTETIEDDNLVTQNSTEKNSVEEISTNENNEIENKEENNEIMAPTAITNQQEDSNNTAKSDENIVETKEELTVENIQENSLTTVDTIEQDKQNINQEQNINLTKDNPTQFQVTKDIQTNTEKTAPADTVNDTEKFISTHNKTVEKTKNNTSANTTVSDEYNSSKNKKNKTVSYKITNDKNDFISQPRTKKELKAEVKQKKLEAKTKKKQAKLQAKLDKKSYEISNTNSNLIAKPRTKKELKEQTKIKKKQAKEKAKQAKLK